MADVKTEQEPSIEEILESIRQIISDDADGNAKAPAAPAKPAAAAPPPPPPPPPPPRPAAVAPAPAPAKPAPQPLDLTEKVAPPPAATIEMMDSPMTDETNNLMSAQTADAATEALSKLLANNVAVEREDVGRPGKVTLEEMTRELMKPLIKTWLDQNLPGIIERLVQKEVEKLSRRAMDR